MSIRGCPPFQEISIEGKDGGFNLLSKLFSLEFPSWKLKKRSISPRRSLLLQKKEGKTQMGGWCFYWREKGRRKYCFYHLGRRGKNASIRMGGT